MLFESFDGIFYCESELLLFITSEGWLLDSFLVIFKKGRVNWVMPPLGSNLFFKEDEDIFENSNLNLFQLMNL